MNNQKFKSSLRIVLLSIFCFLCFLHSPEVFADTQQERIVKGVVRDSSGEELIGVSVLIEGTSTGTITDAMGEFSLRVRSDNDNLVFSYIGFASKKLKADTNKRLIVILEDDSKVIEELVVVGYGYQKKETVTGAIGSLSSKELLQAPVTNVSNALAGRLPGLTAMQSTGEPGRNQSKLRIRGVATMNSDGAEPLILVDGVERSTMDDLDPNDIESFNVLKDASATAVFGVKGANGVILITTKSGETGKPRISFSANLGLINPINTPKTVDSYDYAIMKDEALRNDGLPTIFESYYDVLKEGGDNLLFPSKNWYNEFLKDISIQQQYNVNVSGGAKATKYFVSVGYTSQEGLYDVGDFDFGFNSNPKYERYNLRTNFDFEISKNLKTSVRFGTMFHNSNYPNIKTEDLFFRMMQYTPFSGPGVVDGKLVTGYMNDPLSSSSISLRGETPYNYLLDKGFQDTFGNKFNLNWSVDYKMDFITPGLSAKAMIAYDNYYENTAVRKKTIDQYSLALLSPTDYSDYALVQTSYDGNFAFSETDKKERKNYYEGSLNYNQKFGNHTITALLLANASKEYLVDATYFVPRSMLGIVGRVTYNYLGKYMAEYNLGYNGSEQFPEGNRFGFFPAFSLGWTFSEEAFFPKNNILTYGKLRGSYGEVGNDKIGNERFLYFPSRYSYETGQDHGYSFGERGSSRQKYTGSMEGDIGYPGVTWERARKFNIGLDLKLFEDQLSLTGDYFTEKRNNILRKPGTLSDFLALKISSRNIGEMENKGFELAAGWMSQVQNLRYWANAHVSFARNKILFADEAAMPYYWMNDTGYSYGQYKAYRSEGLYNYWDEVNNRPLHNVAGGNAIQRGDLRLVDVNGDGIIDDYDKVPTGYNNAVPEISYGFSLGASYKGFDCSFLLQGVSNSTQRLSDMYGWAFNHGWQSVLVDFKERWSVERFENGERISKPRLSSNGATNNINTLETDYLLQDMSYLRLKNVEIGYTFSPKSLEKIGVKSIRLYVNGNNLLTFTDVQNVDPETISVRGEYYPLTRVFNFGGNIQF